MLAFSLSSSVALNLFGGKKPGRGTLYSDITQTIGNSESRPASLRRRLRPLAASITASSPPPLSPPPSPHRRRPRQPAPPHRRRPRQPASRHGTAAAPPLTRLSPAAPLSAGRQDFGQAQPVPGRRVRQVRVLQPARVGQGPPRARHHPGRRGARRAQAGRHRRRGEPFRKSLSHPHTAAAHRRRFTARRRLATPASPSRWCARSAGTTASSAWPSPSRSSGAG